MLQDDPQPPADLIRQMGAQTFAIGITDAIGDAQLLSIAGSVDRVSKLVDFAQLDYQFMSNFRQQICIPISSKAFCGALTFIIPYIFFVAVTSELGPWIGLSDLELENRFQWTDSSDLDYQNWLKARPSNRSNTHKCVQFDKNSVSFQ